MQKIILSLVQQLIQDNMIEEDEKELYRYGFTVAFLFLINISIASILSILFGNILVLSFFLFTLIPFRKLIGGFHNATPFRCFISNQILMLLIQKLYPFAILLSLTEWILITLFCGSIFLFFSGRRIYLLKKYDSDYEPVYFYYVIIHFFTVIFILLLSFRFSKPAISCIINYTLLIQGVLAIDTRNIKNESCDN